MSFPAASLDAFARISTLVVWSLAGLGLALALAALPRGDGGAVLAGAVVAVGVGGLGLGVRRQQPVAYDVATGGLVVRRRAGQRRYAGRLAVVDAERPFHVRDWRLLGSGGLYGYTGRFSLHGIGRVRAHVTASRNGVVVAVGEERVYVSPADRAGFVVAVADAEVAA